MDEEANRTFDTAIVAAAAAVAAELVGGFRGNAGYRNGGWDARSTYVRDDETEYCRARAEIESRMAGEASDPRARDAHLEMAALYRKRSLIGAID